MKKILVTVLSLVLALSVFVVPMTASASTATESVFDPVTTTFYTVQYDGIDAYVYSWTPSSDGKLTLAVDADYGNDDAWVIIENSTSWFDAAEMNSYSFPSVDFNVTGGTTYNVRVQTWSGNAGQVDFAAYFVAGSASGAQGSGTMMDPYVFSATSGTVPEVTSGSTVYCQFTGLDATKTYDLAITTNAMPAMMDAFEVACMNNRATAQPMMGTATITGISPDWSNSISVTITSQTMMPASGPFSFTLTESAGAGSTVGTENDPDTLVLDTLTTCSFNGPYYYTYTATADGVLSMNMQIVTDWVCAIRGGAAESAYATSNDDPVVNPVTYSVAAGETVTVWVCNTSFGSGEVYFTASFTEPSTGGAGGAGGDGGEEGAQYLESTTPLTLGTNSYEMADGYDYTVFVFTPEETGEYSITTTNSSIGVVGYYWVNEPIEDVLYTAQTWECTAVGQSVYIGVASDEAAASITVTKESDADLTPSYTQTDYENTVDVDALDVKVDVDTLTEVDIDDDTVDTAVLGEDGYYHLGSADGGIIYVDLNDTNISLVQAVGYGSITATVYEDDTLTEVIDFTEALNEYIAAAQVEGEMYLVPLTADLVALYQGVGENPNFNWYGADGWLENDNADAWLFAAYAAPAEADDDDVKTGDTADMALWVFVAMVSLAGAAVVLKLRKA